MGGEEAGVNGPNFPGAEVAVAVPAQGTFHYLWPEHLIGRVPPGSRVLVPFGPRQVTGYVLDQLTREDCSQRSRLKEIIRPLDKEPLFGPEMVSLFRFISRYYHYPLGLVIAEALPAGLKVMSHKTVRLTETGISALAAFNPAIDTDLEAEAELLRLLGRPDGLTLARINREKPGAGGIVPRLEAKGWVTVESQLNQERAKIRTERWLALADGDLSPAGRLGQREKELLDLLQEKGPLPASTLKEGFPTLNAMIGRLTDKGRITLENRQAYRDLPGWSLDIKDHHPTLTSEQNLAVAALEEALPTREFSPFALFGITGSGKTEVYLAAAQKTLDLGRSVLILVPEISLTPALEGVLKARFKEEVAVMHSALSDGERLDQWLKICRKEVRLVLGARSAIFAPLSELGLIVVDEEHDGSYKQDEKLKYQARDLALLRGRDAGAVVVLGSATPSLETFQAALNQRYRLLVLSERVGESRLPKVNVVDMRLGGDKKRTALTPMLKKALAETLESKTQALLFINRRGTARLPMCLSCGFVVKCFNCSVTLTLHNQDDNPRLICHYCGFEIEPLKRCPECGSKLLRYMGLGTERLEQEVIKAFPQARVGRLDADTARPKGEMPRILKALRDRELDVLVGTQMITKGHDFPGVTLVGVIEADLGLHLPDFRAAERTFQLLAQVSGRAGRGQDPGRVIIQTYSPDHYTLLQAERHDFPGFFDQELRQREELGYPPFSRLILLGFKGNSEKRTREAAENAARLGCQILKSQPGLPVELMGPAPAPLAKIKGKYRFQILVRGGLVKPLHIFINRLLSQVRPLLKGAGVELGLDVDPYSML